MTEVETGTQIPIDAGNQVNDQVHNNLTARGQDASVSIANAQIQASQQTAMRQYYLDVAKFGLDRAQLNYTQSMGKIQAQAQYNSQLLQAQQGRVQSRENALKMLADRSGPQDLVAYNYLLNRMGKPTGQTVDPTSFANEIKDPVMPDTSGLNAQLPPEFAGGGGGATGGAPPLTAAGGAPAPVQAPGATSGSSQAAIHPWDYGVPSAQNGKPMAGGNYSGVPNEQVAGYGKGATAYVQTGTAGGSKVSDYNGWNVYGDQNGQKGQQLTGDTPIAAGQNVWLQRLSHGTKDGMIRDLAALIGEGTKKKPAKTAEMVVNPTGAPIGVLDPDQTRAAMKSMAKGQKGYAGGTFGESNAFAGGQQTGMFRFDSPVDPNADPGSLGSMTPEQRLAATQRYLPGGGGGNTAPHGYQPAFAGGGGGNAAPGVYNDPMRGMVFGSQTTVPAATSVAPTRPQSRQPIVPRDIYGANPPAPDSQPTVARAINVTNPPATAAPPPGSQPTVAPGINVTNPQAPAGAGGQATYGMPSTNTYTKYDPSTFGNMPAWQKFLGNQPGSDFGGFGATLSNQEFGIKNAPWAINLQNYLGIDPSERDNVQSIYKQGLGVDWRDIYGQAMRAAPMGASFGPTGYN